MIVVQLLFQDKNQAAVQQVTLKQQKQVISTLFTDYNGVIKVSRISKPASGYDLFLTNNSLYDLYLTSIKPKTSDTVLIKLPVQYKKRLGKVVCPKCGKTNKVIRSAFAESPVKKVKNRGIIYKDKQSSAYLNSTLAPQWYCTRDSILF